MTASTGRVATPRRTGVLLRVLGAAALGVSAYVHIDIARGLPLLADGGITLMGLFMAQGVVAALVAVWIVDRWTTPAARELLERDEADE